MVKLSLKTHPHLQNQEKNIAMKLKNHMKNLTVVATEFQHPGNCGALARVCANFDIKNIIFLNPSCNFKSFEAAQRAKHANSFS